MNKSFQNILSVIAVCDNCFTMSSFIVLACTGGLLVRQVNDSVPVNDVVCCLQVNDFVRGKNRQKDGSVPLRAEILAGGCVGLCSTGTICAPGTHKLTQANLVQTATCFTPHIIGHHKLLKR